MDMKLYFILFLCIIFVIILIIYRKNYKETFKDQYSIKKISNNLSTNVGLQNNNSLKCVVYCNYNDTSLINFLANDSIYSFVITHLHIIVNWAILPINTNITNVQSFIQDISGINLTNNVCNIQDTSCGLITPMIQQVKCLEQNCLQQLQILQQKGIKIILAMQPGSEGYYGFRTIPNDLCSCQAISPNNPLNNVSTDIPNYYVCPQCFGQIPDLQCPYLTNYKSIGLQLVNDLVESFFSAGNYRPVQLQYDGADIVDQNYYCASNNPVITNCTGTSIDCTPSGSCIPPSGSYSVYNILQFMYNLKYTAQIVNPNFTLSKALIYDCDLVCNNNQTYTQICDPGSTSNVITEVNLGIIDYGCSFYTYNDPYGNFYSPDISYNQMILSLDFSQTEQQQNYQTFMQYTLSHNYGGITLLSLQDCSYGNIPGNECNLNVDDILGYWNSLLCTNSNSPYYINGSCSECLTNTDCSNNIPYCINGTCNQCIFDYDCSQNVNTPYCTLGQCTQCLPGFTGTNCICPIKTSSCIYGVVVYNEETNACDCSCNTGWSGTSCNVISSPSIKAVFGGHDDSECYGECPNQITDDCNTPEANLWSKIGDGDGMNISCASCSGEIGSKNYCDIKLSTFIPNVYLAETTLLASKNPIDPLWYEVPGMTNCSSSVRGESNGAYLTNYTGNVIETNTNCNSDTLFYVGRNAKTSPNYSNIIYGTFMSDECPIGWDYIRQIYYNPLNPYTGTVQTTQPISICSKKLNTSTNSLLITGGQQNVVTNAVTTGKSYNTSDNCTGSYSGVVDQSINNVIAVSLDINNILNGTDIISGDDYYINSNYNQPTNICYLIE